MGAHVEVVANDFTRRAQIKVNVPGIREVSGYARVLRDGDVRMDEDLVHTLQTRGVRISRVNASIERVDVVAHIRFLGTHNVRLYAAA